LSGDGPATGVIAGLAAAVTMDKMLIEIEEYVGREKFKAEMIGAIHETKEEFKLKVRGM
jgi:hypothetical protein